MRKAYYTLDLTEAVLLKDHLVQNGVGATVMNKGLVRIPYDGFASEIWIADDAEGDEVRTLIRGFLKQRKAPPVDVALAVSELPRRKPWRIRALLELRPRAHRMTTMLVPGRRGGRRG